ncbi:MAG: formylglycine-generating enzyme family protein [Deinococcales bacterium]
MGSNPSHFKGNRQLPVECVSWDDVQSFLKRLNNQGYGWAFSLPTEAEWEYACRAGTQTPFSFGSHINPNQVNYDGNYPYNGASEGLYRKRTVAVGSLPCNGWGLYEMHGNVWEWCEDWKAGYESGNKIKAVINPRAK